MQSTQPDRRALVVGLGISGIATAIRLHEIGWEPVIAERAQARRTGGYFIMLFGAGVASAGRLGALDAIGDRRGTDIRSYQVDRSGRRWPGMSPASFGPSGGPRPLLRSDVENGLFSVLPDDVEIRFATEPVHIVQTDTAAHVTLRDNTTDTTATEAFDLVVGADGIRSTVRGLAFDPGNYLHPLNYMIGATMLDRPLDGFGISEGLSLAEPGRSVTAFPFADHPPSLLFSYRTTDIDTEFARTPIESIRAAFGPEPAGPVLESLYARYENAPDALFDSVQQVKMPRWHRGRVVLIGDAAWCLTLYSGMGASTGIAGGELLGTLLQRHDHHIAPALHAWETRMRPLVDSQQAAALTERRIFTPHNRREQIQRSMMMRLASKPAVRTTLGKIMVRNKGMQAKNIDIAAR